MTFWLSKNEYIIVWFDLIYSVALKNLHFEQALLTRNSSLTLDFLVTYYVFFPLWQYTILSEIIDSDYKI